MCIGQRIDLKGLLDLAKLPGSTVPVGPYPNRFALKPITGGVLKYQNTGQISFVFRWSLSGGIIYPSRVANVKIE